MNRGNADLDPSATTEDLPEVDEEELEAAESAIVALDKTARIFQLYPANNKILVDFIETLTQAFERFLALRPDFPIEIEMDRMVYEGRTLYVEPNRNKSLSMKLYRDGVHRMTFEEGLQKSELVDLLDVLTKPFSPDDLDDDVVTLLWEKGFEHIKYYVVEDEFPPGEPNLKGRVKAEPHESVPSDDGEELWQQMAEGAGNGPAGVKDEAVPTLSAESLSSVITITDHDMLTVRSMLKRERARDLRYDLTTLLYEMLHSRQEPDSFRIFVSVLGRLVRSYVSTEDLDHAAEVIGVFREFLEADIEPENREAIDAEIRRLSDAETVTEVVKAVDRPLIQNQSHLRSFLVLLGPGVLGHLISALPLARNQKLVSSVIAELGQRAPEEIFGRLTDPDPAIVQNLIGILGRSSHRTVVAHILPHLSHEAVSVRLEVVRALVQLGGADALNGLFQALKDHEYQVRILALRCIEELGERAAVPILERLIEGREFNQRSLFEKKELFRTLGKLGQEDAIPFLSKMLEKSGWISRSKADENRICAAEGLAEIRSSRSIRVLDRQSRHGSKAVREACKAALGRVYGSSSTPQEGN